MRDLTRYKSVVEIKRVYRHPLYKAPSLYNDLAKAVINPSPIETGFIYSCYSFLKSRCKVSFGILK